MHLLPTRRHLAAEGTTFRLLVDEVRGALAEEMLSHRMSVAEVAERLGYAEVASFSHAFKRWKGPPRASTGPAPEQGHRFRRPRREGLPAGRASGGSVKSSPCPWPCLPSPY